MAKSSHYFTNRRKTLKKKSASIKCKKSLRKKCKLKFRLYKNNRFVKYS